MLEWLRDPVNATTVQAVATVVQAVGGIILLFVTGITIQQTRKIVRATEKQAVATTKAVEVAQEQALLTRSALEASIQPLLVDIPPRMHVSSERIRFDEAKAEFDVEDRSELVLREEPSHVLCSVPFRNVGAGVALVRGVGLRFGQGEIGWSGKVASTVISPDELTRLNFAVPKDRPEFSEYLSSLIQGHCVVEIAYTNSEGTHPLITRAVTFQDGLGRTRVRQIFLMRPGESEPFAASGPADL
jgi:hypothetical protein